MYYQSYEDYMRNILGYSPNQSTYADTYFNYNRENAYGTAMYSSEIMNLYPEVYKIINPMVCKICEANTKPITRDLVEKMTDEIYLNIESDPNLAESTTINVRVNLPKDSKTEDTSMASKTSVNTKNRDNSKYRNNSSETKVVQKKDIENSGYRQRNQNSILRDLIKILILNQLLGGNRRPPRPNPPRPPYPGPRPPIQPRVYY